MKNTREHKGGFGRGLQSLRDKIGCEELFPDWKLFGPKKYGAT